MRALAAGLLLLPACAASAPDMDAALDACLDAASDRAAAEACVGVPSAPCLDADPTTVGMMSCLLEEEAAWLSRLAALSAELETQAALRDAQGDAAAMGLPTESATLAAAELAWDAFREAECAWRYARWGAGTMRQLIGAACRRDLAAARALHLSEVLAETP